MSKMKIRALRTVVAGLRSLVKEIEPGTKETVNVWGVPTFVGMSPFAFYMAAKKHVTFGFPSAASLPDPEGLLEGAGKNIQQVKLRSGEDLENKGLRELIIAASQFGGGMATPGMGGKSYGVCTRLIGWRSNWRKCLTFQLRSVPVLVFTAQWAKSTS